MQLSEDERNEGELKMESTLEKQPKEIKNYTIVNEDETESGTFKGRQPRQAALKAISTLAGTKDKPVTIALRARGEKKQHIFKGYVEMVKAPAIRPKWMPEMIKKPYVEKLGIKKVT